MSMTSAGRERLRATVLIYLGVFGVAVLCDLVLQPFIDAPGWARFIAGVVLSLVAIPVRRDVHAKINRKYGEPM